MPSATLRRYPTGLDLPVDPYRLSTYACRIFEVESAHEAHQQATGPCPAHDQRLQTIGTKARLNLNRDVGILRLKKFPLIDILYYLLLTTL